MAFSFDLNRKIETPSPINNGPAGNKFREFALQAGERRRIMILSPDPIWSGYIHTFYGLYKGRGLKTPDKFVVCPVHNQFPEFSGQECPLCKVKGKKEANDAKQTSLSYPQQVGLFPVFDFGKFKDPDEDESVILPDEYNGKSYQFQVKFAFLTPPSTKSAGSFALLHAINKKAKQGVRGAIVNVKRSASGEFRVGGNWELNKVDEDPGASRIVLPPDTKGQAEAIKAYIRARSTIYGNQSDEAFKYLEQNLTLPGVGDIPKFSPKELVNRYSLHDVPGFGGSPSEGSNQNPASGASDEGFGSDEDIPF